MYLVEPDTPEGASTGPVTCGQVELSKVAVNVPDKERLAPINRVQVEALATFIE